MRISTNELFIVLAIVLLIFGPKQIPKLVKMCKRGINSVRGKMDEDDEDDEAPAKAQPVKQQTPAPEASEKAPAEEASAEGGKKKSFFGKKKD